MTSDAPAAWDCEAYGPEAREFGATCFLAGTGERVCPTIDDCRQVMDAERKRIYRRISELAASGREEYAYLESEFSSPDQLLGGSAPDQQD